MVFILPMGTQNKCLYWEVVKSAYPDMSEQESHEALNRSPEYTGQKSNI